MSYLQAFAQAIKALSDGLAWRASQRLGAAVNLDAGNDAWLSTKGGTLTLGLEQLGERCAAQGGLAKRLLEENDTRDVLLELGGREEQLTVRLTICLDVLG